MTRHHHSVDATSRRRPWPTVFAVVAIAIVAGCTAPAEPSANRAALAETSPAAATSRSADGTGTTPAADDANTGTTTTAIAPASPTAGSGSAPARTRTTAAGTTTPPPRTVAPAGRAAPSTAAAPSSSKRAPATPTASRAVTSSPRPPTTAVAPETHGNIDQTVPVETPITLDAAPLTAQARPDTGVAVQVTDIRAVTTEARFPGEISGPGIAVTIRVVNSSSGAIDLDNAIVDVRGSDGARGIAVSGSPAAPMSGSLPPGQQTSGVYVFTIPQDQRRPISIRFSYAAETPIVLFVGDAQ